MSTLIAGTESGVSITRYSRGNGKLGYQVTWVVHPEGSIHFLSFDNEDEAYAVYHLVHNSLQFS